MKASDLYNPLVKFILKSPLHRLMSGNTLLLTFTGHKSGRRYTTPINFARKDDEITIVTNRKHGWWKNLQTEAPVTLHLQGHQVTGAGIVMSVPPEIMLGEIQRVYRGIPPQTAERILPDMVVIKIHLN